MWKRKKNKAFALWGVLGLLGAGTAVAAAPPPDLFDEPNGAMETLLHTGGPGARDDTFARWRHLLRGASPTVTVNWEKTAPWAEVNHARESDACPQAQGQPLAWLRPRDLRDEAPYRRTLVCVISMNDAFGGWWDMAPFGASSQTPLARQAALQVAA